MKFLKTLLALSIVPGISATAGQAFKLTSQDFKNGGKVPTKCTKVTGAKNISPQLSWSNVPPGTKAFVIACIDIHPIARNWVHWIVIDIPATVSSIGSNASGAKMPAGAKEMENSFGFRGWGGPRPPAGTGVHKYVFTIYALNTATFTPGNDCLSEDMLLRLLKGKVLAKASIIGTYEQN